MIILNCTPLYLAHDQPKLVELNSFEKTVRYAFIFCYLLAQKHLQYLLRKIPLGKKVLIFKTLFPFFHSFNTERNCVKLFKSNMIPKYVKLRDFYRDCKIFLFRKLILKWGSSLPLICFLAVFCALCTTFIDIVQEMKHKIDVN